jgi:xanthosine phosphorylase
MTILKKACEYIRQNTYNFVPKVGIILGSGLGGLADEIENPIRLPYQNIPGFPVSTAPGHAGVLVLGHLMGVPVMCMQGRVHRYEDAKNDEFKLLIRTFKLLGCSTLLVTNASGSLRPEVTPGNLVLITDHINFQHISPLMGPNDDEFGPRFLPMEAVYDLEFRNILHTVAKENAIHLYEGVNMSVMGPCFETPAEIRAYKILGADVINMSTVPEVIVARHCGLRVAAVAAVTNLAAGMGDHISHEDNLIHAGKAAGSMKTLFKGFLEKCRDQF